MNFKDLLSNNKKKIEKTLKITPRKKLRNNNKKKIQHTKKLNFTGS